MPSRRLRRCDSALDGRVPLRIRQMKAVMYPACLGIAWLRREEDSTRPREGLAEPELERARAGAHRHPSICIATWELIRNHPELARDYGPPREAPRRFVPSARPSSYTPPLSSPWCPLRCRAESSSPSRPPPPSPPCFESPRAPGRSGYVPTSLIARDGPP